MSAFYQEKGIITDGVSELTKKEQVALKKMKSFFRKEEKRQIKAGLLSKRTQDEIDSFDFIPHKTRNTVTPQKSQIINGSMTGRHSIEPGYLKEADLELDPLRFVQQFSERNAMETQYLPRVQALNEIVSDKRFLEIMGQDTTSKLKSELGDILRPESRNALFDLAETVLSTQRVIALSRMSVVKKQLISLIDMASIDPKTIKYIGKRAPGEELLTAVKDPTLDVSSSKSIINKTLGLGMKPVSAVDTMTRKRVYRGFYHTELNRIAGGSPITKAMINDAQLTAWRRTQNLMGSTMQHQNPKIFKVPVAKGVTAFLSSMNSKLQTVITEGKLHPKKIPQLIAGQFGGVLAELYVGGWSIHQFKTLFGADEEAYNGERKQLKKEFIASTASNISAVSTGENILEGVFPGGDKFARAHEEASKAEGFLNTISAATKELAPYSDTVADLYNAMTSDYYSVYGKDNKFDNMADRARVVWTGSKKLPETRRSRFERTEGKEGGLVKKDAQKIVANQEDFNTKKETAYEKWGDDAISALKTQFRKIYNIPSNVEDGMKTMLDSMRKMSKEEKENFFSLFATKSGEPSAMQAIMIKLSNMDEADPLDADKAVLEFVESERKEETRMGKLMADLKNKYQAFEETMENFTGTPKERSLLQNSFSKKEAEAYSQQGQNDSSASADGVLNKKATPRSFSRGKLAKPKKNRVQCGETTNDWLGYKPGGPERMENSLPSKQDGKSYVKGGKPIVGGYFVEDTGTTNGHCGVVTGVTSKGMYITDSNYKGKGKMRENFFISFDSKEYEDITGFGGTKNGHIKNLILTAEKRAGRKLSIDERKKLVKLRGF